MYDHREIDPCPYCGEAKHLSIYHSDDEIFSAYVACCACWAKGPRVEAGESSGLDALGKYSIEDKAITKWNVMSGNIKDREAMIARHRSGYTEKDAKRKLCPVDKNPAQNCVGSGCMAWTWLKTEYGRHKRGYCSLLKTKQES
ncbi:hypothetical protein [Maridesulfovibrio sp.]|uniref:hypothetical protein n=1 Tax=Maridesulfovibrio sp. TaxID=2795000 RepID=UPI0029CA9D24|nr:hypothetical protein [Maridesulfovibrio sp.]